jgi:hypothetical protein
MRTTTATPHGKLTWRQAALRVAASVGLGLAIAAAMASHGSASAARVEPAPPGGTTASQLSVLRAGPIEQRPPSAVSAGLDGAGADLAAVRLLGRSGELSLYAAPRSNGGACHSLIDAKGAAGTACVEEIPREGITVGASDAAGWTLYGFAADDVIGVDVVLGGRPQPALLLANAYIADLGLSSLDDATALVVHHRDGTVSTVTNPLRVPGS